MPSPFPGMDPYLEEPGLWPDVHHGLISQIQAVLNPSIRPTYVARVELRVYLSEEDDPGRKAIIPDLRIEKSSGKGQESRTAPRWPARNPSSYPYSSMTRLKKRAWKSSIANPARS